MAFRNLLAALGETWRLTLIIDGLDEFHENHAQLVELLREANKRPGVKICASSRPWNIFRDEYKTNPQLQLHHLTRQDIKLFVQERLHNSPGYQDFADTNPQTARKIIADLVEKSQGVFLWVSVISALLESCFQEGASAQDLQAEVEKLPSAVSDLFRYIWHRTSPRFRLEAARFFRVKNVCYNMGMELFALTLWFGDTEVPINISTSDVTETYLKGALRSVERKLMSRTGGLLELTDTSSGLAYTKVEFMHRTASDWVADNWQSILLATDQDFCPCFWVLKGEALSRVLERRLYVDPGRPFVHRDTGDSLHLASSIAWYHPDRKVLIEALDRLEDYKTRSTFKYGSSLVWGWGNRQLVHFLRDAQGRRDQICQKRGPIAKITFEKSLSLDGNFDVAAIVPIGAYVAEKLQQDEDPFTTVNHFSRILANIVLGELWFMQANTRRCLLKLFLQDKFQRWFGGLKKVLKLARIARDGIIPAVAEQGTTDFLKEAVEILEKIVYPDDRHNTTLDDEHNVPSNARDHAPLDDNHQALLNGKHDVLSNGSHLGLFDDKHDAPSDSKQDAKEENEAAASTSNPGRKTRRRRLGQLWKLLGCT
ncbi:hypothetical protein MFIFM68171_06244 [Madurella fahalii]|uniref:DUF7791 domain-containing protein n=1 Tax=Madurella fahalii TaxID=1157608 RepID=A0ABQ0GEE1_9PEZI